MHTPTDSDRAQYKNVWVIGEVRNGELQRVTFELLGAARKLANARKSEVWCVLMGQDVEKFAKDCFERQADAALVVDAPELKHFCDETQSNTLCTLIAKHKPEIIITGATAHGRALIPRVAVKVVSGLTADCTALDIDPETGALLQTRPAFGGNIMATIKCTDHRPQMSTVRPRVMAEAEHTPGRTGKLVKEAFLASDNSTRVRVLKEVVDAAETVKLADAKFIVTGGRGVKSPEGFKIVREFASLVDGAVGASRAAVDAGWIDYSHQVGQTGQTVQPSVYMACGVSGQIQHLVGMQSSDVIIAVNKDPEAPMMKLADYAVTGDLFEVLPALSKEIKRT